MSTEIWEGDMLEASVEFRNDAGELSDPTTVKFIYEINGGDHLEKSGADITHDSLGRYHYNIDTTHQPGRYVRRWESTGDPQTVTPDEVCYVKHSKVASV